MSRFTRQLCVAAVVLAAVAPAAGAAVYQHSPGIAQSVAPQVVGYAHSPDLNPYRNLQNFDPSPSTPAVSTTTTSSFDWADAGIGAGALAGVLLLAGAMAIVVRRPGTRKLAV